MKQIRKYIFLFFLFCAQTVFASEWKLETNWPDSPAGAVLDEEATIAELVQYFFEWAIILGVIITFGILVYASLKYIIAAGDPNKLSDAKNKISSAFLGLLLLIGSWLLISILNPELANISEVSISTIGYHEDTEPVTLYQEEDLCDYGIITYSIRGEAEIERTLIEQGDVKMIPMEPHSSVACKSQTGFGNDIASSKVRFIKARVLDDVLYPECNIDDEEWKNYVDDADDLKDPQKYPQEIWIEMENSLPKYCYKNIKNQNKTIKYISQKPDSEITTCLAGDRFLIDGGGCALNLYETNIASRCGHMISSTSPVGNSVGDSYDKKVNCVEIVRHVNPTPN